MPPPTDQVIIYVSSFKILSRMHLLVFSKKSTLTPITAQRRKMPTNAWFDSECNELRKTINTYAKRTNLTDTDNNNDYYNLCNDYKRMIQRKKTKL